MMVILRMIVRLAISDSTMVDSVVNFGVRFFVIFNVPILCCNNYLQEKEEEDNDYF